MNDRMPQMRALSSNTCPNSRRRSLREMSLCDDLAFTMWGYCCECWREDRVPRGWVLRVGSIMGEGR